MPLQDILSSVEATSMTLEPPLPPGVYDVTLTGVRAAGSHSFAVVCSVPLKPGIGSPVLWTVNFEFPLADGALDELDRLPPMKWVIGDDGQISGLSDPDTHG